MTRSLHPLFVIAALCSPLTAGAEPMVGRINSPHTLTIRLYTTSAADAPSATARSAASALLDEAGVHTRWVSCEHRRPDRTCAQPLGRSELSVRLVRQPHRPATSGAMTMGTSLVDATRHTGVLATIYRDRVDALAASAGVTADLILARALAHEVAHLVLGSTDHGLRGLMRPLWSRSMLRDEPASNWVFTSDEATNLRAALAARQ